MGTDLFLVVGLPILTMVIHYCVQPNRYGIIEGLGCGLSVWPEVYAILGVSVPPVLLGVASFGYGGE